MSDENLGYRCGRCNKPFLNGLIRDRGALCCRCFHLRDGKQTSMFPDWDEEIIPLGQLPPWEPKGTAILGWVYVLSNPAMPWLLKIGRTEISPKGRADQLSGVTGVPIPFQVEHHRKVADCAEAEDRVHGCLVGRRVNKGREFFAVSLREALEVVDEVCAAVNLKYGFIP